MPVIVIEKISGNGGTTDALTGAARRGRGDGGGAGSLTASPIGC
jgi:hypothetical protein